MNVTAPAAIGAAAPSPLAAAAGARPAPTPAVGAASRVATLHSAIPAPSVHLAQATAAEGQLALFNFPGVAEGQQYEVIKGSKVGRFNVTGTAELQSMTPDGAAFRIEVWGRFGLGRGVTDVSVSRLSDTQVLQTTQRSDGQRQEIVSTIVENGPNKVQLRPPAAMGLPDTRIERDPVTGNVTLEAHVIGRGDAKLTLVPVSGNDG